MSSGLISRGARVCKLLHLSWSIHLDCVLNDWVMCALSWFRIVSYSSGQLLGVLVDLFFRELCYYAANKYMEVLKPLCCLLFFCTPRLFILFSSAVMTCWPKRQARWKKLSAITSWRCRLHSVFLRDVSYVCIYNRVFLNFSQVRCSVYSTIFVFIP